MATLLQGYCSSAQWNEALGSLSFSSLSYETSFGGEAIAASGSSLLSAWGGKNTSQPSWSFESNGTNYRLFSSFCLFSKLFSERFNYGRAVWGTRPSFFPSYSSCFFLYFILCLVFHVGISYWLMEGASTCTRTKGVWSPLPSFQAWGQIFWMYRPCH